MTSDAFSRDELDPMKFLGAKLTVVASDSVGMSVQLTEDMIAAPAEPAKKPGCYWTDHKIEGVGAGFVVPLWQDGVADRIERVSTHEAVAMALRLAREEGLLAGTSTGGNVIAALRLAEELGPDATLVTLMCDSRIKYLSTALFQGHTATR